MAVHFQEIIDTTVEGDENSYNVVDGSQFVVSRTVFKDNSSYYEIDGKRKQFKVSFSSRKKIPYGTTRDFHHFFICSFQEVSTLLKKRGVDLDHNRFLILQGEVEQIALMKPKGLTPNDTGMLEFLEDIIGSSRCEEQPMWARVRMLH